MENDSKKKSKSELLENDLKVVKKTLDDLNKVIQDTTSKDDLKKVNII